MLTINERPNGITLECRVTPRARKSGLKGEREGTLLVALQAPPTEGRANEELIRFLARILGIPPSHLSIIAGKSSRTKVLYVENISKKQAVSALSAVMKSS